MAKKAAFDGMTISEWTRNKRENIRVALKLFRGRKVIELRTWWKNDDGKECPGTDGITLDIRHTRELAQAFRKARRIAKKRGLLADQ